MPVRIYDIAKKLGLESVKVIAKAKSLGITAAKVPSSSLDIITAKYLEEQLAAERTQFKSLHDAAVPEPLPTLPSTDSNATTRRLVIPIRNRDSDFFAVSPWFLGNDVQIQQISDEDYATLHREEDEIFVPIVTARSQCLITGLLDKDPVQAANELAAKVQFVFKSFSLMPVILSHAAAVKVETGKKAFVERSLALPAWGDYGQFLSSPFEFKEGVSAEKVTGFFQIVASAIAKQPGLLITLSRFNSCYLRSVDHDKVIDIAVSLESL